MPILICDAVEWDRAHRAFDYPNDVGQWIIGAFGGAPGRFVNWKVQRETQPPPGPYEGVVVGGSPASAFDPDDWIHRLAQRIREWADARVPLLGICFGHQLIARALGGRVIRNPRGWEVANGTVDLTPEGRGDPLFDGLPSPLEVMQTHWDIVAGLPQGAECLATSPLCPIQSFRIGPSIRTVQFHPEYTVDHMRFVMLPRRDRLESAGIDVKAKLATLRPVPDSQKVLVNFETHFVEGARFP